MRCTLVMPGLAPLIREPGTSSPFQYARRVYQLAAAFVALFLLSLLGIALLVWKARLFVSLTQRSNVETLTLAFFALFFTYLGLLSAPGLAGTLRIAYYDGLIRRLGRERLAVERLKAEALGPPRAEPPFIAINRIIEHADRPGERLEIAVGDGAGGMGVVAADGAALTHRPTVGTARTTSWPTSSTRSPTCSGVAVWRCAWTPCGGARSTTRRPSSTSG
ncbi:MAG TPA: hypothetical protein VGM69_13830 [Chloroflexota bacterium]|jgi:hypothetical protein